MLKWSWSPLSSYVLYFMDLNTWFRKGVHRLHQAAKGAPGPWLPSQESTLENSKMGSAGEGSCTHIYVHTHTHKPCWECAVGLSPGTRAPCQAPVALWCLTDSASPGTLRNESQCLWLVAKTLFQLSQRNTIYYEHVFSSRQCLEKVSLYEYLEKARS